MWPFTSTPAQNSAAESSAAADKCPVDHSTRAAWLAANPGAGSPFQPASGSSSTAQAFEGFTQAASSTTQDSSSSASDGLKENVIPGKRMRRLSEDRVISSIPRFSSSSPAEPEPTAAPKDSTSTTKEGEEKNWVYPSEAQFFRAMLRKHEAGVYAPTTSAPDPSDMQTIVPIHNAVNEKAWQELLKWEAGMGGEKCGGVRLVSFKGRPKERTPKAWINVALG
jgi:cytochrome c heme-lyase